MGHRYAILIPHYCHDSELAGLLPQLAKTGLPTLVVDDGSDAETLARLRALIDAHAWASLVERDSNGGKGAAMLTGLRLLAEQGFTHVISMDADGQHDVSDLAVLHCCSRRQPEQVFSGCPVFGDDIPSVRRYGRTLTNTLARIEAGCWRLKDAMCGLRLYPLAAVLPLHDALKRRPRMEFDIEILVRLCWAGRVPEFLQTRVIYPQGGRSHFRLLADNARLVRMHTMLLVGALWRLPRRWLRR